MPDPGATVPGSGNQDCAVRPTCYHFLQWIPDQGSTPTAAPPDQVHTRMLACPSSACQSSFVRSVFRFALAVGVVSPSWAGPIDAQPAVARDCGGVQGCTADHANPPGRDGFVMRLAFYQPPQGLDAAARPAVGSLLAGADECGNPLARANGLFNFIELDRQAAAGHFEAARRGFAQALAEGGRRGDGLLEGAALVNLGVVAAAQGHYAEAKERLQRGLARYRAQDAASVAPADESAKARLIQQLIAHGMDPRVINDPSRMDLSMITANLTNVQSIITRTAANLGAFVALLDIGNLAGQLGQYAEAEAAFQQAAAEAAKQPGSHLERLAYGDLAVLHRKIGQLAVALDWERRAAQLPVPEAAQTIDQFGLIALGRDAEPVPDQADVAQDQRPSAYAEAAQHRMQAEALAFERHGDLANAALVYSHSATLAASVATPDRELAALADLARVHAASAPPPLAIFSGKRAVNAAQRLRVELSGMERTARQAYLADKKRLYATLADLLLQQNRLAEAEQVLRLLKEDEGQQFQPSAQARRLARGTLPYTLVEAGYLARYRSLAERTQELEAQRQELQCGVIPGAAIQDRAQLERNRVDTALQMGASISQLEAQIGGPKMTQGLARVRQLVAIPRSARTPADQRAIIEYQQGMPLFNKMVAGMGASLRAVQRDGPYFLQPLSNSQSAAIDALVERVARLQSRTAPLAEVVAGEPPPPPAPAAQEAQILSLASLGMPQSQRAWAIDRQLEALDAERARLDVEARDALGGKAGVPIQFTTADDTTLEAGRQLLTKLPAGTVAIYYLGGERQLDILVVTRSGRTVFRQPVTPAQLDARIKAFRLSLQNRHTDPRDQARALYDLLLSPAAPALRDAGASTLMLSLDGQLRYLPFAALHDGQGWLAERYALDLYTSAAPAALLARPAPRWQIAAFGRTAGAEGFSPLPAVRAELESIVRDASMKSQGVLPGVARLDRDFTAASLSSSLRGETKVIHIASHFAFQSGDPRASFLLLGDGSRLSLADLASPDYRFDRVDLVTLSACETALNGDDSYGQEVEGLGTLLQGQGAAAVLATFWNVADTSTATFMHAFYAQREAHGLSRAQALRQAQLAFIRGEGETTAAPDERQRGASREGAADIAVPFHAEAGRPLAHPYYWAPFVLMGNWL